MTTKTEDLTVAPPATDKEYGAMQKAYKSIRTKMINSGASMSIYAFLMWAYEDPDCQTYYKNSPWLLRVHIAQAIQQYCAENEEELVAFNKGVPHIKPALDF